MQRDNVERPFLSALGLMPGAEVTEIKEASVSSISQQLKTSLGQISKVVKCVSSIEEHERRPCRYLCQRLPCLRNADELLAPSFFFFEPPLKQNF